MGRKLLLAAGILLVFIAGLLAYVATRPDTFRVTRSAVIDAAPAAVFEQVNDLRKWQTWSPWAEMDPNARVTFEGTGSGRGAAFHWAGNDEVGEGTMTITESRPNERVRFRLDFVKPFAGSNDAEFAFAPEGEGTRVTWTMSGRNAFVMKAVGLFMDCDKMVGDQFEKGLANLRAVSETAAR